MWAKMAALIGYLWAGYTFMLRWFFLSNLTFYLNPSQCTVAQVLLWGPGAWFTT